MPESTSTTPTPQESSQSTPLFVYGSLMIPEILSGVANRLYSSSSTCRAVEAATEKMKSKMTPATLYEHKRYAIEDHDFPAVLPSKGNFVQGYLVTGLSEIQRRRVDDFEGELYQSRKVSVVRGWGKKAEVGVVEAEAFIWVCGTDQLYDGWTVEGFTQSLMYQSWVYRGEEGVVEEWIY